MNIPDEIAQRLTLEATRDPGDPVKIHSIKHEPSQCEHCERTVQNQRVHYKVHHSPQPHWRARCATCGYIRNPDTGEFTISSSDAQRFFIQRYRE